MIRYRTYRVLLPILFWGLLLQSAWALGPAGEKPSTAVQAIPFKQRPMAASGSVYHIVLITMLAAGVAVGCAFLIKKYLQQRGLIHAAKASRITILDTRRVSPKLMIFLISVDGMNYLLIQSADRTTITQHHTPPME